VAPDRRLSLKALGPRWRRRRRASAMYNPLFENSI
jgi:hypothetical protein